MLPGRRLRHVSDVRGCAAAIAGAGAKVDPETGTWAWPGFSDSHPRGPPASLRGCVRDFWRALRRNRLALIGGVIVACLAVLAIAAPLIAPWDPNRPDVKKILNPPGTARRHRQYQVTWNDCPAPT